MVTAVATCSCDDGVSAFCLFAWRAQSKAFLSRATSPLVSSMWVGVCYPLTLTYNPTTWFDITNTTAVEITSQGQPCCNGRG